MIPASMVELLGFGTGGLMGRLGRRRSEALLRAAVEAGYKHVDTSRLYGGGQAERLVGRCAGWFPPGTTFATKAGLGRPRRSSAADAVRTAVRPFVRVAGGGRSPVPPQPPRLDVHGDRGNFDTASLEVSLRTSEQQLRRAPDYLLLHQIHEDDVTPQLADLCLTWKESGRIDAVGLATSVTRTAAILEAGSLPVDVVQVEGGPLLPQAHSWDVPTFVHSLFGPGGAWLRHFHEHLSNAEGVPEALGSLSVRELGAALIQMTARTCSYRGLVLFSSTPPGVKQNADDFRAGDMSGSEIDDLLTAIQRYHGSLATT
jgi:hypothetical protein